MKIDQSTIVVTGGAGLIGSTTVDLLLNEHTPRSVVIFDNFSRGSRANIEHALRDPRVSVVNGDISDRAAVARVVAGADAVIHMAALRITACAAEPRLAFDVMCGGSFNVVEAAQASGVNFSVYGPRMDVHGKYTEVLIRWMERIDVGRPPLVLGDGTQTMDFVYVEDAARANVLALASDVSDDVFNVATGVETSLNDLAAALGRVMGVRVAPEYGPERKVNPVSRRLASTEKAKSMLGFSASVTLDEGLSRLVKWWRAERVRV